MTEVAEEKVATTEEVRAKAVEAVQSKLDAIANTRSDAAATAETQGTQDAAKPAAADAAKAATDAAAGESTWNPRELSAMKAFGETPESIQEYGAKAKGIVARLVKNHSAIGKGLSRVGQLMRQARAEKPPEDPSLKVPGDEELDKLFDPDDEREKLLKRAVKTALRTEQAESTSQRRQAEAFETDFAESAHELFASLDAGTYPEIGGGQAAEDVAEGGPEAEARQAIIDEALNRVLGHFADTGQKMSIEDAVQQALLVKYPEAYAKSWARQQARGSAGSRAVMRPTGSRAVALGDPRSEAIRRVQEAGARHGMNIPP